MQFDKLWGEEWLKTVCPHVDLKEVEWLSDCSAAAIPCGLLVRVWQHGYDPAIDGDGHNVYSSPQDADLLAFRDSDPSNNTQGEQ